MGSNGAPGGGNGGDSGSDGTDPSATDRIPRGLRDRLDELDPSTLRAVARYAQRQAEEFEGTGIGPSEVDDGDGPGDGAEASESEDDETAGDGTDELEPPDDVPSKATIVVKTINDNRYYYWQWRDGEKVRSKYEGPVDPDD